jgi:hypothetical protein
MQTRIDVVNQVLSELGVPGISAWDEDTRSARAVRTHWDQGRQFCLSLATWRFSRKRQQLAQLAAAPSIGYDYAYQLPADYLRPIAVLDSTGLPYRDLDYTVIGDQFHTNETYVWLDYVRDLDDVGLWPSMFIEVVKVWLMRKLGQALAGRAMTTQSIDAEVAPILAMAVEVEQLLAAPEPIATTLLERVRYGEELT